MITNRRNSDPQLEDLKGLAVAFINQATSKVEKKKNRNLVAKHFRLKAKRKADWESLAEKGNLFVPDYPGYRPVLFRPDLSDFCLSIVHCFALLGFSNVQVCDCAFVD